MGDHVNGPCFVKEGGQWLPIHDWLTSTGAQHGSIPFLFKVLSVGKSLSIQSHPNAELARRLHAERPDVYKDSNPKPEIAIALTAFSALLGFRSIQEISEFASSVPELALIMGESVCLELASQAPGSLKRAYSALMTCDPILIRNSIESLVKRPTTDETHKLAKSLDLEYPGGDVGVLSVFFLNHVTLSPGEAIFMGPDTPHAYLSGDIIECMTCSDNVIRGGLTPKFKDVPVLLGSLVFAPTVPAPLAPVSADGLTTWRPVREFGVTRVEVVGQRRQWRSERLAIAIVVEGEGTIGGVSLGRGQSVIIPPGSGTEIVSESRMLVYIADSAYQGVALRFSEKLRDSGKRNGRFWGEFFTRIETRLGDASGSMIG